MKPSVKSKKSATTKQYFCKYCGRGPFPTARGQRLHTKHRPACRRALLRLAHRTNPPPSPPEDPACSRSSSPEANEHTHHHDDIPPTTFDDPDSGEPSSKRVRVEEVEDEEPGGLPKRPWVGDFDAPAGVPIARAETLFERLRKEREGGDQGCWYPFQSKEEWEVARWLLRSGLTQEGIDSYLKLENVSCFMRHSNNVRIDRCHGCCRNLCIRPNARTFRSKQSIGSLRKLTSCPAEQVGCASSLRP